jgi:hypothetical protein
MPRRITDAERRRILDHLATGASCNATAKKFRRSASTVSKIARQAGHDFGENAHSRLARAHVSRKAYGAEARAATLARFHEETDRFLDQLHERHVAFSFGGKDNTYNEHEFDEPDAQTKATLVRAAREAMRTVLDIDRHDNRQGDVEQAAGLIVDLVDGLRGRSSDDAATA